MGKEFRLQPTLRRRIEHERDCGQTIVLVTGCFDLLHRGHLQVLADWGKPGYFLVVGVNSDASITRLKGPGRPILGSGDRVAMLAALKAVDIVFEFDADTPEAVIRAVRPDISVRGEEYRGRELPEQRALDDLGVQVEYRAVVEGISTTAIIERCVNAHYGGLEKKHFGDLFATPGDEFFGAPTWLKPGVLARDVLGVQDMSECGPAIDRLAAEPGGSLETIHKQFAAAKAAIEENRP